MSVMCAIIKKPANIIEVFSASRYFKVRKVIIYTPSQIIYNSLKPEKIDLKNYINSFNPKELNFKIEIRKIHKSIKKEDHFRLINKILKNTKIKFISFTADDSLLRIYIYFKKNITTIGLTDGSVDCLSILNYFIINKSKNIINFLKIPFYLIMFNFFKLDFSFSYFDKKIIFSKKTIKNFKFTLNRNFKNIFLKKKIKTLILEDPSKTLQLSEIINKYKLSKKNYCSIGRHGSFKFNNKENKKYSILPELLLNNIKILKVLTPPQSSVYLFAKKLNIKTIKLPSIMFNFPYCSKIFHNYILQQFFKIK